jgi:hypothetical protein
MKFYRNEHGGIVLEAALTMPFFLTFVLALISFILVSVADVALYSAVSEVTKQVAAHTYPVELLANDFKQSKAGRDLGGYLDTLQQYSGKIIQVEQLVENYSAFIPDFLLQLVRSEQMFRGKAEELAGRQYDVLLNKAFTPVLLYYADKKVLQVSENNLRVVKVTLPDLTDRSAAYFGLEAEYTLRLPLPFLHKVMRLKKKAYERVWVGA